MSSRSPGGDGDGVSRKQGPGGRELHVSLLLCFSSILEVNTTQGKASCNLGHWLQHGANKQTRSLGHSPGRVCHFMSPDLNLICLLLVLLSAVADMEPGSQPLDSLFERGEIFINGAFFRQWARGRMALGIFDRIKWLTQKRKFCRLWNNPPILISSASSPLLIFFFSARLQPPLF